MVRLVVVLALSLICSSGFAVDGVENHDVNWYRQEARAVMRRADCGRCHIPSGNAKALKIYNLDETNWTDPMSDGQVGQIKWRIDWTNEDLERKGGVQKFLLGKADVKTLHDFVDRELAYRKSMRATVDWLTTISR
jgi:hypothetical protein